MKQGGRIGYSFTRVLLCKTPLGKKICIFCILLTSCISVDLGNEFSYGYNQIDYAYNIYYKSEGILPDCCCFSIGYSDKYVIAKAHPRFTNLTVENSDYDSKKVISC